MNRYDLKQRLISDLGSIKGMRMLFGYIHWIRRKKARMALQKSGLRQASMICNSLSKEGLQSFAIYGSLLGLIREGRFMEYDDDIDIAVVILDNKQWEIVEAEMTKLGLAKLREFGFDGSITEQTYTSESLYIDLFGLYSIEDKLLRAYYYTYEREASASRLVVKYQDIVEPDSIVSASFDGVEMKIPSNFENMLEVTYGPNWRTPMKDWDSSYGYTVLQGVSPFAHAW